MEWTFSTVVAEIFYCVIGLIFILTGIKALRDSALGSRFLTAGFWFILAFTFIAGPYLPKYVTGVCVILMAVLTALGKVRPSKSDVPSPETTRAHADRMGYKVFIPALALALTAVLVATFWTSLGANNAIGVSALVALFIAFALFKCKPSYAVSDGSRLIAVAVYCIAMALFTIIMGNGFAAFSVITVGVGIPFLIMQGANPVVVGAMGLTAGYCGTLLTPMAANFNIMPAALLETKDKYSIIKAQAPVALTMLAIHIVLMYLLAF